LKENIAPGKEQFMQYKRNSMIHKLKLFLLNVFDFLFFVFDDEKKPAGSKMKASYKPIIKEQEFDS
jgi:hypothetical protein